MGDFCVGLAFLCLYLARIKPAVPWIRSVQTECSIGHAEFRIFQTGFFVEWKALGVYNTENLFLVGRGIAKETASS